MEVLKFSNEDYDIIIRTRDIKYSWKRFKGRIHYSKQYDKDIKNPENYCRYTSKDEGSLTLYNPIKNNEENQGLGHVWDDLWPVVFETCKYQFRILFHNADKDSIPEIRHVRKDIEESFFYDEEISTGNKKSLTGEIDFLNEPGIFKLDFAYRKNGLLKESYFTFDVVSPKLDTKNDYKTLLREVNEEYENIIYRYLSLTVQQFNRGKINTDATWMSAFQSVVEDYLKNIKRIIHNPHSKIEHYRTSRKAEHIKSWTPKMEEKYGEVEKEGKLEEHYFEYDESKSTHDTMENRFVKYTLDHIGKRLSSVINTILRSNNEDLSVRHRKMWEDYKETISKLSKNPFFRTVGKYEGHNKESLVLQSRMGYQQIYKDWLKLKRGIDLYNGSANIGTLQIWEIYELWCFIKMKHLVSDVLGINSNNPAHESLIFEPRGSLLNPFTDTSLGHVVEYTYPKPVDTDSEERKRQLMVHDGDKIILHYQHTFNRRSGNNQYEPGISTATTEQRPDIILNIEKDSGKIYLTYLYDAKYRVINDKKLDKDFEDLDIKEQIALDGELEGGDYPPPDSINQMHRYRDAIYYSKEHEPFKNKEIIGGYILFPGRGNDKNIKRRYYSESIKSVNIGAFPLLPNSDSLLKEHLEEILMKYEGTDIHVSNSKPQRTLAYVSEEEKAGIIHGEDVVMVAVTDDLSKRQWSFNKLWYNIPIEAVADSPWNQAKYLLLYIKGQQYTGELCKIIRTRHEVWTSSQLLKEGYPNPNPRSNAYFMIRIRKPGVEVDDDLKNIQFDVKNPKDTIWGNVKMAFYLARMKDLNPL